MERVTEMVRRELPLGHERLRAAAALGAIGSITMHHTSIVQRRSGELASHGTTRSRTATSSASPTRTGTCCGFSSDGAQTPMPAAAVSRGRYACA